MQVIKKINNNAAICLDSADNEIVAIGTGIGFPQVPYDLEDLSIIQSTYYGIDPMYLDLLNQAPTEVFDVSDKIVEIFRNRIDATVSSNLVFTLADHINFAIERLKKNLHFENALQYEIQHLYEAEYEIGLLALGLIKKELGIRFPKIEASNISLHLINAEAVTQKTMKGNQFDDVLSDIVEIIGEHFQIYIDKSTINYSRFVSHFQYLMKRQQKEKLIGTDNSKIFDSIIEEYPDTFKCVKRIRDYLKTEFDFRLDEEELLYLILHVNRLCVREDCHRKGITPPQKSE